MEQKKFTMVDENFICDVCNQKVESLGYSARDHCPFCLCSKHVDINPGDRQETCHGILKPIGLEKSKKDTYKIIYKCDKCHKIKKNTVAKDDDYNTLLKISSN